MDDDAYIAQLHAENTSLSQEVSYLRSILFVDMNPTNASLINALRHAVDAAEENKRSRSGNHVQRLEEMLRILEDENARLRDVLQRDHS